MSEPAYAVIGVESDVHVRQPEDAVSCIECVDCKLRPNLLRDNLTYGFIAETPLVMVKHLVEHLAAKHKVPLYALTELLEESLLEKPSSVPRNLAGLLDPNNGPLPTTPEEIFNEVSSMALLLSGMVLATHDKDPGLYADILNWAERIKGMRVAYFDAASKQ